MKFVVAGIYPVFLLFMVLSACSAPVENQEVVSQSPADLLGVPWKLMRLTGADGDRITIPEGHSYDVHFVTDSTLIGNAHCNTFSASYAATEEGRLLTGPVSSALVLCAGDSPIMIYLEGIGSTTRYELEDEYLHIEYGEKGRMTFNRNE